MQFNTFVTSSEDIQACTQATNLHEVLLEPSLLAVQGTLGKEQALSLAQEAKQKSLRPILVWDALMTEHVMARALTALASWPLDAFAAIRVIDVGAAFWLREHYPSLPIQLLVEAGSHNIHALQGWIELLQPTLERLILSIELPEAKLIEYCQTLPVQCELLGAGRIQLFYSPRALLTLPLEAEDDDAVPLRALGASEISNHRPFAFQQSKHGTLMFLDKDQFILDRLDGLKEAGLHTLRIDLRHLSDTPHAASSIASLCDKIVTQPDDLRKSWERPTRAPFFRSNNTTAQFKKLRTGTNVHRDQSCLGKVIATENKNIMIIQTFQGFDPQTPNLITLPNGEDIPLQQPVRLRDLQATPIAHCQPEEFVILDWQKKVCVGTLLRHTSDND